MLSYADSLLMKVDEVQLQFGDEKLKLMSWLKFIDSKEEKYWTYKLEE